ncbi:hypothetical protein JCM6882_004928 [Rhodosporidiobolus microsporus]
MDGPDPFVRVTPGGPTDVEDRNGHYIKGLIARRKRATKLLRDASRVANDATSRGEPLSSDFTAWMAKLHDYRTLLDWDVTCISITFTTSNLEFCRRVSQEYSPSFLNIVSRILEMPSNADARTHLEERTLRHNTRHAVSQVGREKKILREIFANAQAAFTEIKERIKGTEGALEALGRPERFVPAQ